MRRLVLGLSIVVLIIFIMYVSLVTTHTIKEQMNEIQYGLEQYDANKTLEIIRTYDLDDSTLLLSKELTPTQNFFILKQFLDRNNITYNYTRAGDPKEFILRGGDCYDYTMFITSMIQSVYNESTVYIVVMNVVFPDGHKEGHMFPIFEYIKEENGIKVYGVYDIPTKTYFETENSSIEHTIKQWQEKSGLAIEKIIVYKINFENGSLISIQPIKSSILYGIKFRLEH